MRPTPIPDGEVWAGAERVVFGPPPGHEDDVASVELLADRSSIGPRLSARCALEAGDLETLQRGGVVWVSFAENVPDHMDSATFLDGIAEALHELAARQRAGQ